MQDQAGFSNVPGSGKIKVCLTGCSSYLASVLLPFLENDPEIEEIIGIDLKAPGESYKKLNWIKCDVRDEGLYKHLLGCQVLVHLAFIVMPIRKESLALEINIEGSKNVFRSGVKAGIKKIVYASSCAAYGAWADNPEEIKEDFPRRGMRSFYYSYTKAKVEEFLDEFEKEQAGLIITRLRPPIFIGPKINNLVREMVNSRVFFRIFDRGCKVQLAWDEDVARAFYLAIKKDFPGAFNIGGEGYLTQEELFELAGVWTIPTFYRLALLMSRVLWNLRIFKQLSPGWIEVMAYPIIMNLDKARKVMGFEAAYTTRTALVRFLEEMRKKRD